MMDSESRIANKKARKIAKHFTILINGKKIKIINYRFKKYQDQFETGQIVELISKIKFPALPESAIIEIDRDGRRIQIQGKRKCGSYGPGNYIESFIVNEINDNGAEQGSGVNRRPFV